MPAAFERVLNPKAVCALSTRIAPMQLLQSESIPDGKKMVKKKFFFVVFDDRTQRKHGRLIVKRDAIHSIT